MSSKGPVNFYHSLKNVTMLEERSFCQAADNAHKAITVPLLYIGQAGDWVCTVQSMKDSKKLWFAAGL